MLEKKEFKIKKIILENNYLKKKYTLIALSVVLFFTITGLCSFVYIKIVNSKKSPADIGQNKNAIQDKIDRGDFVRRKIDGVFVEKGKENLPIIAVMINNHVDARPTSGLAQASLVYEAEVEGGITRFMAVYDNSKKIDEIGSIRSARPYFLEWVNEFSALYAHCGGSPEALVQIIKDDITDLNEFNKGKYYWRDNSRIAPHNIYTSSEKLNEYLDVNDIQEGDYFSWNYKDDLAIDSRPASSTIEINYKSKYFAVEWKYDQENNGYQRYVLGKIQKEKNGEFLFSKNVIIQESKAEVLDEKLRLSMDVIGEGEAIICLDGTCSEGKWKKGSKTSRTRYYSQEKNEVELNAGPTWIQVVRPEIVVNY